MLHFPENCVKRNEIIDFVIKKNCARGNIDLKVISPVGRSTDIPLQILDPDRFGVKFIANDIGLYNILIKFNGVALPKSPYSVVCVDDDDLISPTSTSTTPNTTSSYRDNSMCYFQNIFSFFLFYTTF